MHRRHIVIDSPVGPLTLVGTEQGLSHLHMNEAKYRPSELGERVDAGFEDVAEQLGEYFSGDRVEFDVRLDVEGTAFHRRVWQLLRDIPYGQTRSYGQLAEALGDRHLAQAVGWANGHNPVAIIIPCHRVIGADGSLTGYAGGLDRKRFLLELEEPAEVSAGRLF